MVEGTYKEEGQTEEHKGWAKSDNISNSVAHENIKFSNWKKEPTTKYALQERESLEGQQMHHANICAHVQLKFLALGSKRMLCILF